MKRLIAVVLFFVLAIPLALAERVGVYDDAKVYLYDTPCKKEGGDLRGGQVEYKTGKVVGLCWIEESGVVWIIDDEGIISAEDPRRFKPMVRT